MPRLTIDERPIEVPTGTKVITAAEQLGIQIPRFCYHSALGSVGACRVCAVNVLEGPVKGLQMSCMLEAKDGMVVSSTDPEAVAFRRYIIEWLMLHHPHDCPVCDEGGHCLLQDMTVSGGHGLRRYRGPKRTHRDQFLGPLVQHEMNRCIQCYRCVRYYREYTGYDDLGVSGIGHRVYYGRFEDGVLESPFTGNLSDICPTGVYTDKPSRFKGRRWDFERTPSICIHCSLGCHITTSARYREIIRHEARFSPMVNGHFICDRGRHGHPYASAADRPREARVDDRPVDGHEALQIVAERLAAISAAHGPQAVAVAGSERASLETLAALVQASQETGWRPPVFFEARRSARNALAAVQRLSPATAVSLQAVEGADVVVAAGIDPVHEAPMLAVALRQAQRRGALVCVADPRPVTLPFEFDHHVRRPSEIAAWLAQLTRDPAQADAETAPLVRRLAASQRPLIVAGTDILPPAAVARAADLADTLAAAGKAAGLFYALPGPNSFGAALLAPAPEGFDEVVEAIENGAVKALIVVENDLSRRYPDRGRLERALGQLDLLVVMDCIASAVAPAAHVFLPTTTVYEEDGWFINNEGRAQRACAAIAGGTPIAQTGQGDHPPRTFDAAIPENAVRPAANLVAALAAGTADAVDDAAPLAMLLKPYPDLAALLAPETHPPDGRRVLEAVGGGAAFALDDGPDVDSDDAGGGLDVIWTDRIFGSESLSARSPALQTLQEAPFACMTPEDAGAWQIENGARVALGPPEAAWELTVRVVADMAKGTIVLPRLPGWQQLGLARGRLHREDLRPGS